MNRRSNINHALMEVLQILKYFYRGERLDFTDCLLATEEECLMVDIPTLTLDELVKTGNIEGLQALIAASYN